MVARRDQAGVREARSQFRNGTASWRVAQMHVGLGRVTWDAGRGNAAW